MDNSNYNFIYELLEYWIGQKMIFTIGKIFWWLANPGSLLLLLIVAAAILLMIGRPFTLRWGRRLIIFTAILVLAISLLPIRKLVLSPLESRFSPPPELAAAATATQPPSEINGIIILGGAINPYLSRLRHQLVTNDAAERLIIGLALARQFPNAKLVYSGGSAILIGDNSDRESDYAIQFFRENGIAASRIIAERDSRNTNENAIFTKQILQPKLGENWILVTSAFHMPRAVAQFRGQGWSVIPYPADYNTAPAKDDDAWFATGQLLDSLNTLQLGGKEWIGLLAARLSGQSHELFPRPQ